MCCILRDNTIFQLHAFKQVFPGLYSFLRWQKCGRVTCESPGRAGDLTLPCDPGAGRGRGTAAWVLGSSSHVHTFRYPLAGFLLHSCFVWSQVMLLKLVVNK